MIAHVCIATGWTWDYVSENIDLPRLASLNAYWKRYPPLHVMVAGYLGITGEQPKPAADNQDFAPFLSLGAYTEGPIKP